MQGYAGTSYRRLHAAIYGGVDQYYTPFCRVEKGALRRQDEARLHARGNDAPGTVPQIIFGSSEEFAILARAIKALGFDRIDLNLGCPYPMQTRKGRGASMIGNVETMKQVCQMINADNECAYSVKMRLGANSPCEWRALMPLLNDTRLLHVAVHPRIAAQMYAGELDMAQFEDFLSESAHPVVYNGEIRTVADIASISEKYPSLSGMMIGRGFLARPSLAREWLDGRQWTQEERMAVLMRFHDSLLCDYEDSLCGPVQVLQHIKPFWDYLEPEIGHKTMKAIKKASSLDKYRAAICALRAT